MKKIALLLLALVLVFPVFAADNRVDFSMGYGGTFLYSTEVKSDPMETQKFDFTLSGANYFLSDGDMGIAYVIDFAVPTYWGYSLDNADIKFNLGLSVMFDYNLDITEDLSMDFAAGLGYDWSTIVFDDSYYIGTFVKQISNYHLISLDTQIAVNYAFAESFAVRGGFNISMPFVTLAQSKMESNYDVGYEVPDDVQNMKMIGFGISGFVGVSYLY